MLPLDPLNPRVLLLALLIEAALGYPAALDRLIGHPVAWLGALIAALDRGFNRPSHGAGMRRALGVAAVAILLVAAGGSAALLALALRRAAWGWAVAAVVASSLLAQRSLGRHVAAVARAVETGGVAAGRRTVAHIVGRDPEALDRAGVCRAAIESLAENFSDGVVAPAFWLAIAGLPGIALYKAINTADSMIGYRTARHRAFGWAAARLDDLVNLPASRLTALALVGAAALLPGAHPGEAWRALWRDARHHRSPNAGWCEAAMAGALDLRLGGKRIYGGTVVEDGWMGAGRAEADATDIGRALRLYRIACGLIWLAAALAGIGAELLFRASAIW